MSPIEIFPFKSVTMYEQFLLIRMYIFHRVCILWMSSWLQNARAHCQWQHNKREGTSLLHSIIFVSLRCDVLLAVDYNLYQPTSVDPNTGKPFRNRIAQYFCDTSGFRVHLNCANITRRFQTGSFYMKVWLFCYACRYCEKGVRGQQH